MALRKMVLMCEEGCSNCGGTGITIPMVDPSSTMLPAPSFCSCVTWMHDDGVVTNSYDLPDVAEYNRRIRAAREKLADGKILPIRCPVCSSQVKRTGNLLPNKFGAQVEVECTGCGTYHEIDL